MDSNRMTEGVGKKIVEALKQQSDIEIIPVKEETLDSELATFSSLTEPQESILDNVLPEHNTELPGMNETFNFNTTTQNMDNNFSQMLNINPIQNADVKMAAIEEMELPSNVAVLRQLITKIPAGVSKQTGAMIIKQTMEALGIPMTSVLQEAQQVQEKLTQSVRECQTNILEYKKQINILEVQAQKYQRQFAAVNDIISLFIQTSN